jgi:hypothetical protein
MKMHWAAAYIGKPWQAGACGPHAYFCWGLVQAVCAVRHRVSMPTLAVGTADNQHAIFEAVRVIGWSRVDGPPKADDIALMRTRDGRRHCGYMVEDRGMLGVLHADGHQAESGPVGRVVWVPVAEAAAGGYHDIEFWRHAA